MVFTDQKAKLFSTPSPLAASLVWAPSNFRGYLSVKISWSWIAVRRTDRHISDS